MFVTVLWRNKLIIVLLRVASELMNKFRLHTAHGCGHTAGITCPWMVVA